MKTISKVLAFVLISSFISACSSPNYKNQPWMPSKAKGKPMHGHSKRASVEHREYNNF